MPQYGPAGFSSFLSDLEQTTELNPGKHAHMHTSIQMASFRNSLTGRFCGTEHSSSHARGEASGELLNPPTIPPPCRHLLLLL